MNKRKFAGIAALALAIIMSATLAIIPSHADTEGPGFTLENTPTAGVPPPPAPSGGAGGGGTNTIAGCESDIAKYCVAGSQPRGTAAQTGGGATVGARACLSQNSPKLSRTCETVLAAAAAATLASNAGVPACSHSPVCYLNIHPGEHLVDPTPSIDRVIWNQPAGWTYAYPFVGLDQRGGVIGAVVDSKDNVWVFQRNAVGKPQLFKYGPDHRLIFSIGDDVITHQYKAHGITVDSHDNVWIADAGGSTVKELSPDGKVLMTIGVRGHRGDWVESKGQRLLWQPMDVKITAKGDIFIGEGHANESPNDTDSDDPTDNIGAARVIHLDKNGKFINQIYGNDVGPGRFSMAHGIAVDPKNNNIYIGDREEYRIVVYTEDGKWLRTIQMRNLTCALYFDPHGDLWMATGEDGQLVRINKETGKVLMAVGKGDGFGNGQFHESNFMGMDSHGNLYAGDTTVPRVTMIVAPKK